MKYYLLFKVYRLRTTMLNSLPQHLPLPYNDNESFTNIQGITILYEVNVRCLL